MVAIHSCRPGFYKAFAGNVKCSKCPPHSLTHTEATSVCQCEKGYFRAEKDPPTMACTRPPSAPRNVVFNINETALMLEWSPPSDTGGRKDLTYSVVCKKCGSDANQCEICGGGIRFVPRHTGLTNSSVTVLDFVAHVNYTFEIEATNGVSELSFSPKQFTAITVTTDQDDKKVISELSLADICSRNVFHLLCSDIATAAEVFSVEQELNWQNYCLE
ncbi:ephrin type-A receptor 6-like protein [Turdus rufiventris]|nr:ephrin type-A receptor 6-like protein [Turdus rufiventris]